MEEGLSRVAVWARLGPWEDDLDPYNAQGPDAQGTEVCLLLCAEGVICQHAEPFHLGDGLGSFRGQVPCTGKSCKGKGKTPGLQGGTVRVPQTWAEGGAGCLRSHGTGGQR